MVMVQRKSPGTPCGVRHVGFTHTETQQCRLWTARGRRCVGSKNSQTTPTTTSTAPVRQLLRPANTQTAHTATSSTTLAHQPLGSRNAETGDHETKVCKIVERRHTTARKRRREKSQRNWLRDGAAYTDEAMPQYFQVPAPQLKVKAKPHPEAALRSLSKVAPKPPTKKATETRQFHTRDRFLLGTS